MYNAIDVANYIIEYSNNNNIEVNNLIIQKLIYYINAYNLYENNNPFILDTIEKWKFGPVIPEVYFNLRHYGRSFIKNTLASIDEDDDGTININYFDGDKVFTHEDKELMNFIIESLGNVDRFELVEMTHKEPMWNDHSDQILAGDKNLNYTSDEIERYFKSLSKDDLPWRKNQ